MPRRFVHDYNGMTIFWDVLTDDIQMVKHLFFSNRTNDNGFSCISLRANGSINIRVFKPHVFYYPESLALFSPQARESTLLSNARFVLKPYLYCRIWVTLLNRGYLICEVFTNRYRSQHVYYD